MFVGVLLLFVVIYDIFNVFRGQTLTSTNVKQSSVTYLVLLPLLSAMCVKVLYSTTIIAIISHLLLECNNVVLLI